MMAFASVADLVAHADRHADREIGTSDWLEVTQAMIDAFAHATGDHQWIHVDVARARAELPGGRTIAHGFLTLSLIPQLAAQCYALAFPGPRLNYGLDRLRFVASVRSGERIRLHLALGGVGRTEGGVRVVWRNRLEGSESPRPVLVADTIVFLPAAGPAAGG